MNLLSLSSIMLVDIVGAVFAIACLAFVHIPNHKQNTENVSVLTDIKLGFQTMRQNKPLMAVFFPMAFCIIICLPLGWLIPLLVRTNYQGSEWHNRIIQFVYAAGAFVSSIIMGIWGGKKKRFFGVSVAIVCLGLLSSISGILTPALFPIFVVVAFLMGYCNTLITVPVIAYIQETTEQSVTGRVMSLLLTTTNLAMPIGLLIAGPISEMIGISRWFQYAGFAVIIIGILCFVLTYKYDNIPKK